MEASELRQFSVEELKGRIAQWKDELFRARFKAQTSEAKDTSVVGKLRRDIARAATVMIEKEKGIQLPASAMVVKTKKTTKAAKSAKVEEDKPAAKTKKKAKGE